MIGEWRNGFPRVTLTLLSERGPTAVEFIVDTGFNGDIALPESMLAEMGLFPSSTHYVELAGGFRQRCFAYQMMLEWDDEERLAEVLTLDGNPLVGNGLWQGFVLQAENLSPGEVLFEPV